MSGVLIIDDKVKLCESLAFGFAERKYSCDFALDGRSAVALFSLNKYDVVLLDVCLGEEDGLVVLSRLRALNASVPVFMITGFATIESAVKAIKLGAVDYIQKPIQFADLFAIIRDHLHDSPAQGDSRSAGTRDRIIFEGPAMADFLAMAKKIANTDLPVLIRGESGTGKELVAEFIHENSSRSRRILQKINCAAFSETLLDNELFGHEKGAYTGADSVYTGVFESANSGSLFLDELGDMPLSIQAKILRAIQNQEIRRLGSHATRTIDVRFITATNKDLAELLGKKLFREDLFYRLSAAVLVVPPLRDRRMDIPLLSNHFLDEIANTRKQKAKSLGAGLLSFFESYSWPGNVRELRSALQYAATVSSGTEIGLGDVPPGLKLAVRPEGTKPSGDASSVFEVMERDLIVKTLKETMYNKKRTAEVLSICRATLYNKMEKYGIPNEAPVAASEAVH